MPHWKPGRWQSTLNTNILKTVLSVVYHPFGKLCVARTQTSDSSFCCPATASSLPRTWMPCIMGKGNSAKCGCCQREGAGERDRVTERNTETETKTNFLSSTSLYFKSMTTQIHRIKEFKSSVTF